MRRHRSEHYLASTSDAHVVYSKAAGVCVLSCGDGFAVPLPTHPKAVGRFSPILTEDVAKHVLTPMEPTIHEVDADVHVARGFEAGGTNPMLTVVWFRVDVTRPHVDMRRVLERLRGRAVALASDGRELAKERSFVASGVYAESGIGILAGRGRHSVLIAGKARSVPYVRATTTDDESLLAELMTGLASVVECVDPSMVSHEHELSIQRGHQYPRRYLHGDAFIKCHQVVIRASGGASDPHGSDMHVDCMDGRGNAGGGWTLYAGELTSDFDHLAVFASATGGIGFDVHVGGYGSDWACAVHLDTANQLHGSVWPSGAAAARGTTRAGFGLRIVTYTLRKVELLEESLLESPDEEGTAICASTPQVKRRILGVW